MSNTQGAWRLPALAAGLTLCAAANASASPSLAPSDLPIARTLAAKPASGWTSVIVKTGTPLTPAQEAQVKALGGSVTRRLPIIGSVALRVPSRNLAKLSALPFVRHLSLDGTVVKDDAFTVGSSEADDATSPGFLGSYQLTGRGVTVAVIDSGVTPLADLSSQYNDFYGQAPSRLLASVNFANVLPATPGGGVTYSFNLGGGKASLVNNGNAFDPCGHGTHVAGIIGGNGSRSSTLVNTQTFYGIAPQANLVSVRVLDQNGSTLVSTVITGLQWVVANQKKYKIRVVNLSLGHPVGESYTTDPLCQAVEAAYKAGIVVVCAAGNNGRTNGSVNTPGLDNEGWGTNYGSIQSPANDPTIITVGATKNMDGNRADDRIATYSSRGPSRLDLVLKPDIIAPGNKVISLDAGGSTLDAATGGANAVPYSAYSYLGGSNVSGDYFQLSGTSMASPVVAGAVALLLQANPSLTPDTVKARLMLSADKWADPTGSQDPLTYGAGYLNVPAALASTVTAVLPALSPTLVQNADGTVSLVMDRAAWGSTATAGSRAAWGTGLWGTGVTDMRAAWGTSLLFAPGVTADRAAWGTNAMTSSRAAWGTSTVWSDRAAWGTSTGTVDLTSTALSGE